MRKNRQDDTIGRTPPVRVSLRFIVSFFILFHVGVIEEIEPPKRRDPFCIDSVLAVTTEERI
jgi:hypothetical protein